MKLNIAKVKNAKPKEKIYKLADGRGLFLQVTPSGGKRWRYKYRHKGKEKLISLGVFPEVSLKEAREAHSEYHKTVSEGIDPLLVRQEEELKKVDSTFEAIAMDWLERQRGAWAVRHYETIICRLRKHIFPYLGSMPIVEITPPILLGVLRKVEDRGAFETAHRLRSVCGQIFRYGIAIGLCERDSAADLRGALTKVKKGHFASIRDKDKLGGLLRAIDKYHGYRCTKIALQLAPLVFVRPGELRGALWSELDLEAKEWRIGAERMKMGQTHIVPLSRQALALFEEARELATSSTYVFPSPRSNTRPLSNNTLNKALRRIGYTREEVTSHGFRATATTFLNEQGYNKDWIERQLAHAERSSVRAAYNYAEYLDGRRKMMQEWSDFLEGLKNSEK